jgi:hypothetical protein
VADPERKEAARAALKPFVGGARMVFAQAAATPEAAREVVRQCLAALPRKSEKP